MAAAQSPSDDELIGRSRSELETPAVCVDLDRLDSNLESVAGLVRMTGKSWRPHLCYHGTFEIAQRQMQAGAVGITVSEIAQAEELIRQGISEVLIENPVVGSRKIQRLAGICRSGSPIAVCDHYAQGEALDEACRQLQVRCQVMVGVNLGLNQIGVRPGWVAVDLARGVSRLSALALVGVMGRVDQIPPAGGDVVNVLDLLREFRDRIQDEGMSCKIVAAGGERASLVAFDGPSVTELHFGSILGDLTALSSRCSIPVSPALSVMATVVSRPKLERAVLDVGEGSWGPDVSVLHLETVEGRRLPDCEVTSVDRDLTTLSLGPESQDLIIGDKVIAIPDDTRWIPRLQSRLYAIRHGRVEEVWRTIMNRS